MTTGSVLAGRRSPFLRATVERLADQQSEASKVAAEHAARLDVVEGDARKLQFSGEPCVLDIYLYPMRKGGEPAATYVDARRSSDGLDVDRASCIAALRQR